jgi:DNA-binding CsgD family transcriptional regulator
VQKTDTSGRNEQPAKETYERPDRLRDRLMTFVDSDCRCLNRTDLLRTLSFMHHCLSCASKEAFNRAILEFAAGLGFEFVLYGFTQTPYRVPEEARVINLSNPADWAREYERDHLLHDPVLHEVRLRIDGGEKSSYFVWDNYPWPLSAEQQRVITRRRHYGLVYGCSVYADSQRKDFCFLLSLASASTTPDDRTEAIGRLIIPQLMATTKRLNIRALVDSLTEKEQNVALVMMEGRTNSDIAKKFGITEHTVKFHLQNIYRKLQVNNRQQAIGMLVAERYLGD